jgi:uncharacterized protein (TIRG00374 family)
VEGQAKRMSNADQSHQRSGPAPEGWESWFFVPDDDVRGRRPSDVALALFGSFLVLITALRADQIGWLESLVGDVVEDVPSWIEGVLSVAYVIGALYVLALVVMVAAQGSKRLGLLRDLLLSGGLAAIVVAILTQWVSGEWPAVLPEFSDDQEPVYTVLRIAVVTAVIVTAAPHVVRPLRRFGWLIILLVAVAGTGLSIGLLGDTAGAIGIGLASAGLVLVMFGSPRGYPRRSVVADGLAALGVTATDVAVDERQEWGVRRFTATADDGTPLLLKAYGRDARDAQAISRAWRAVWYRDQGPSVTESRLHQVEHEALLSILAGRSVATLEVTAAGSPSKELALLVLKLRGEPVAGLEPTTVSDAELVAVWQGVGRLHGAGIAHGHLNVEVIGLDAGTPVFGDLRTASTAASIDRINSDTAELLLTMAGRFGVDRAVACAQQGLGDDALVAALSYLQEPAISSEGKRQVQHPRALLKEVREAVAEATGTEPPKPAQLRRITWRSILMVALTVVAAYALIGMLSGIDFAAVWEELQDADWGWVAVAFVVAQGPIVTDAISMMAAVAEPIPMKPTVMVQSAILFIQLAVGGAAGRLTTNVVYLRRFGVDTTDAVTQAGINTLAQFFIQVVILLLGIAFSDFDLGLTIEGDASWGLIVGLILLAVVVAVLVVVFVKPVHDRVVPPIEQAFGGLRTLAKDPGRLLTLLGANLASQVFYAMALWFTLLAFDTTVSLAAVLVINTAAALLGGLLPIPGGVGVTEAMLTAGLVAAGVDEATAFAAAVTYRVLYAYLPPVWGWFALRWLQNKGYL